MSNPTPDPSLGNPHMTHSSSGSTSSLLGTTTSAAAGMSQSAPILSSSLGGTINATTLGSTPGTSIIPTWTPTTSGGSGTSKLTPVVFDLKDYKPDSLKVTLEDWTHSLRDVFLKLILDIEPIDSVAALVAYWSVDGHTLENKLSEYEANSLKKICSHIGISTPPRGSSDVKGKCFVSILEAVKLHAFKAPHLIGGIVRHPSDSTQVEVVNSDAESDRDLGSGDEEEQKYSSPPRPENSSRTSKGSDLGLTSPRRTPRDTSATKKKLSKSASTRTDDEDEPRDYSKSHDRGLPSGFRARGILSAVGELPDGPDHSKSRGGDHRGKSKGTTSTKKTVGFSTEDEDSDSDGPKQKRKPSKGKKKDKRPPSPSSEEDLDETDDESEDDDSGRLSKSQRRNLEDDMETSGLARPLAKAFIRNALASRGGKGLILDVFKEHNFKSNRNEREVLALARVVDALRKQDYANALELVVRRLVGVQSADTSGNWKMCDAFELVMDRQSYVPDAFLARAIKNVNRLEALEGKKSSSTSSNGSSTRQRKTTYGTHRDGSGSVSNSRPRDRSTDNARAYPRSNSNKGSKDATRDSK
jgi:hypothetical protein